MFSRTTCPMMPVASVRSGVERQASKSLASSRMINAVFSVTVFMQGSLGVSSQAAADRRAAPRSLSGVTIPEDMIKRHLDSLLGNSDPGDSLHHLHVVAADKGATGPLGVVSESALGVYVYAIAYDKASADSRWPNAEAFIRDTIKAAYIDHAKEGRVILFAGMSAEIWGIERGKNDALSERLLAAGRLQEHPNAVEATYVYAACRDGRRWRGTRYLTGPKAGTTDVEVIVGPQFPGESALPMAPWVRHLVGLD
jgi:hypothetical protein